METFEECKVFGNELEKNQVVKFYLDCEKDSAELRIYNEGDSNGDTQSAMPVSNS